MKIGTKVKRKNGVITEGKVLEIREEIVSKTEENKEKFPMVKVKWDNGMESYLDPSKLEEV